MCLKCLKLVWLMLVKMSKIMFWRFLCSFENLRFCCVVFLFIVWRWNMVISGWSISFWGRCFSCGRIRRLRMLVVVLIFCWLIMWILVIMLWLLNVGIIGVMFLFLFLVVRKIFRNCFVGLVYYVLLWCICDRWCRKICCFWLLSLIVYLRWFELLEKCCSEDWGGYGLFVLCKELNIV